VSGVRIGIDFDNTIICYDRVFVAAARRRGLVPDGWTGLKSDVRSHLRSQPGGELAWQGLQGWVYGKGIVDAETQPGVLDFLAACRRTACKVYVVSHKTRFAHQDSDRTDLRQAARDWMRAAGLVGAPDSLFAIDDIFFEDTRAAKVDRIVSLKLDVFIDDLVEVFEQPHFPREVRSILLANSATGIAGHFKPLASWADIHREVFVA
jgi:hypothetical protein